MATSSSEEEDGEEKTLEERIRKIREAKKEIVECTVPFSDELAKLARRERKYMDRLAAEKPNRAIEQQLANSSTVPESDGSFSAGIEIPVSNGVTQSELDRVKFENVELKQSLDQAAKQSEELSGKTIEPETSATAAQKNWGFLYRMTKLWKKSQAQLSQTKEELNETRQRLSDVQKRLTVAEQVTAATQQRALRQSGNSEQLELTPEHQPTGESRFS